MCPCIQVLRQYKEYIFFAQGNLIQVTDKEVIEEQLLFDVFLNKKLFNDSLFEYLCISIELFISVVFFISK